MCLGLFIFSSINTIFTKSSMFFQSPVFVGLIVAVAVVLGLAELIVTEIRLRLEYKSQRIHSE